MPKLLEQSPKVPTQQELDREQLLELLKERSHDIFLPTLKKYLENGPTAKNVSDWAKDNPGDWASSLAKLGRLAGWAEKNEVVHRHRGVIGHIHAMSDAELIVQARQSLGSYAVIAGEPCAKSTGPEPDDVVISLDLDDSTESQ